MKTIGCLLSTALSLGLVVAPATFNSTAFAGQLWEQRHDGPGHSDDRAFATAVDSFGNAIVTGKSRNANGDYDFYTAKYAAGDGQLIWEQRYDGTNHMDDVATAVAVDRVGNVIVTGYLVEPDPIGDPGSITTVFYIAKYAASDGSLLWDHIGPDHGGLNNDPRRDAIKLAVDNEGNILVSGAERGSEGSLIGAYTAKWTEGGALLWERRFCGFCAEGGFSLGDYPVAIAIDPLGNVVVTGSSPKEPGVATDIYTIKYAADGSFLWDVRYQGPTKLRERVWGLAVDKDGNVIITGQARNPNLDNLDYYTAKYASADGTLVWEKYFDGGFDEVPTGVGVDAAGNVFVTGWTSTDLSNAHLDYYTIKYASDGNLVWEQRYDSCNHGEDKPFALAVDGSGNVIVTGYSVGPGDADYYTVKYAAADGAPLWHARYNGPGSSLDEAQAVALDATGNVIVTGFSANAAGNQDYYTVKYSPTGSLPPTIRCPANIVNSANPGQCSTVVNFTATASDDECNAFPVTCLPLSGSTFPVGVTTVTCTAGSENQSSCAFTVTVNDTEKPVITCPANIVTSVPCGQSSVVVNFIASASDNCPGVSVTCSPPSGSVFPAGVTTVNCTARDASGNTSSCSFTVTVNASIFTFNGFLSPVGGADATGGSFSNPLRTFKLNSTIPVKFTASCGGSPVLSGTHRLQVIKYSDQTTAGTPIDATPTDAATTGDQFRLTDSQWQFNLDTKATGMSAGIWLLRATLSDGSQHSAWIQIK